MTKTAFINIDYDEDTGIYKAVIAHVEGKAEKRFATANPVVDFAAAMQFAFKQNLNVLMSSSVNSFVMDNTKYRFNTEGLLEPVPVRERGNGETIFFGVFWEETDGFTYSSQYFLGIFADFDEAVKLAEKKIRREYNPEHYEFRWENDCFQAFRMGEQSDPASYNYTQAKTRSLVRLTCWSSTIKNMSTTFSCPTPTSRWLRCAPSRRKVAPT